MKAIGFEQNPAEPSMLFKKEYSQIFAVVVFSCGQLLYDWHQEVPCPYCEID
jgi:hypothetical protein